MHASISKPDLSGQHFLLVDDSKLAARGVVGVLESAGARISHAGDIASARALVGSVEIAGALVDVFLPDGEGYALVGLLRKHPHPTPTVMLTGFPSETVVHRAISAGAIDVLFKPVGSPAIHEAASNLVELHARWGSQSRQAAQNPAHPTSAREEREPLFDVDTAADDLRVRFGLTRRERGVLILMLRGRRIEEMAEVLDIAENTVRFHIRNVLQKLGLHSRAELFRLLVD